MDMERDNPTFERVGEAGRQGYDAASNKFGQAGDEAQRMGQQARDKGGEAYQKAGQAYDEATRQAKGAGERAKDEMQHQTRAAADQARQAYEGAQHASEYFDGAYQKAAESVGSGYERAGEGAQYAKDKVYDTASQAYDRVSEAGAMVTEPFEHAAGKAKGAWDAMTDRARRLFSSDKAEQQSSSPEWLEKQARALFDHSVQETREFWKSTPAFDPRTMDPVKYVQDFQREMAYHYGTLVGYPRLYFGEVRATMTHPQRGGGAGFAAPASLMFLPLLALLAAWMGRRIHARRRRIHELRSKSEKQETSSGHHATVTPSTAMDTNYMVTTALTTSLYTTASMVPIVATTIALLEFSGTSTALVVPLYLMLVAGTVLHARETVREGASHELPGGRHAARQWWSQNIAGMTPGECAGLGALVCSGLMASYTVLTGKPFSL